LQLIVAVLAPGEPWVWRVAAYKLAGGGIILLGNFLYLHEKHAHEATPCPSHPNPTPEHYEQIPERPGIPEPGNEGQSA
jgi:hypothetical protein